jgi:hypothetical protein
MHGTENLSVRYSYMICLAMLSLAPTIQCRIRCLLVNNKLERTERKREWTNLRHYLGLSRSERGILPIISGHSISGPRFEPGTF